MYIHEFYAYFWQPNDLIRMIKVPILSKFLLSYLTPYITQWTFAKEKFDLYKMQSFLQVLKTFKYAAILVYQHQPSLDLEWVVTYIKECRLSCLTHLDCFTSVNLT